jgi:hypothetical protein
MREAAKNRPPEDQDELPRRSRAGPVSGVSEARMDQGNTDLLEGTL